MDKSKLLGFIVDEMLMYSSLDQSTVLSASKLAEEDDVMFNLMNSWMKSENNDDQLYIDDEITERLKLLNLL